MSKNLNARNVAKVPGNAVRAKGSSSAISRMRP